jgi:hypothetical protein
MTKARLLAAQAADDFFTAAPKYRTRARFIEIVEKAILEGRMENGESKN